jgi:hypothetical protein
LYTEYYYKINNHEKKNEYVNHFIFTYIIDRFDIYHFSKSYFIKGHNEWISEVKKTFENMHKRSLNYIQSNERISFKISPNILENYKKWPVYKRLISKDFFNELRDYHAN